jgi:SAM-dependent methyltransferase
MNFKSKKESTQIYYRQNHLSLIKQYNSITSPIKDTLNRYIKPNHKVLDIGFGSGRDLKYIQKIGAECYGIDSTQEFIDELSKDFSFTNRLFCTKLPNLQLDIDFKFDIVTLIAVIMHLNREEIAKSISNIKEYLTDNGLVIISYSTTPREDDERFFEDLRGEVVNEMFLSEGLCLVEESRSLDSLGRGIEWRSGVFRKIV